MIEAAVNSLELSQLQNQVLEFEFVWLTNVQNRAIDLHTGELMPHNPENYISKLAPVRLIRRRGVRDGFNS